MNQASDMARAIALSHEKETCTAAPPVDSSSDGDGKLPIWSRVYRKVAAWDATVRTTIKDPCVNAGHFASNGGVYSVAYFRNTGYSVGFRPRGESRYKELAAYLRDPGAVYQVVLKHVRTLNKDY